MLGTRKNKLIAIVAIVILLSMILWYLSTPAKEKKEEKVFDDRISPMENQALFVEILRIRNRGLMDKMLSYSLDWRLEKSTFLLLHNQS